MQLIFFKDPSDYLWKNNLWEQGIQQKYLHEIISATQAGDYGLGWGQQSNSRRFRECFRGRIPKTTGDGLDVRQRKTCQ